MPLCDSPPRPPTFHGFKKRFWQLSMNIQRPRMRAESECDCENLPFYISGSPALSGLGQKSSTMIDIWDHLKEYICTDVEMCLMLWMKSTDSFHENRQGGPHFWNFCGRHFWMLSHASVLLYDLRHTRRESRKRFFCFLCLIMTKEPCN